MTYRIRTKRRFRDLLFSPLAILILIVLVVFLSRAVWGTYNDYRTAYRAHDASEARAEELVLREASLRDSAALLGSARAEEETIRETLRMTKPGEEVIVVVPERAGEQEETGLHASQAWWKRFLGWLTEK